MILTMALLLAVPATAIAANNSQPVDLTAAGQAAARAVVLTSHDLDPSGGWTQVPVQQPNITPVDCANFHPKVSDLVINGVAETGFTTKTSNIFGLIEVLATPRMVLLDWQRTVEAPHEIACLGALVAASFSTSKFTSIHRLAIPLLGIHTAAWRARLVEQTGPKLPFIYDLIQITRGRTEISLTIAAPVNQTRSIEAIERRISAAMYARARI